MKKTIINILICGLVIGSLGSSVYFYTKSTNLQVKLDESTAQVNEFNNSFTNLYHKLTSLNKFTFEEKINSGEEFYVYIGNPSCKDCDAFEEPFLELIDEYELDKKLYFLNLKELYLNKDDLKVFRDKYEMFGTPSLAKYSNGKLDNKYEWSEEEDFSVEGALKWFEDNKLK
ncbi:thioredoxin family protein [Clostridium sp.]|uniref:thioredoxin family protein n=1 Tax=Clostridium sp. TaxID=1506 RepID=UPI003F36223C